MTDLRTVELRDATIAYLDEGPRDASAAVLIAGLGDDHTWWDALAHELLAVGYRVIRADNRGVGASSTVDVEHTTADMAGDILRVLDHAETDGRIDVVGASLGGMIAQELAGSIGDRLGSLVLSTTCAAMDEYARAIFETFGDLSRVGQGSFALRLGLTLGFGPAYIAKHPDVLEGMPSEASSGSLAPGIERQIKAAITHDARGRLRSVNRPALVISARHDALFSSTLGVALALELNESRHEQMEGGHCLPVERPAVFNRSVVEFMEAHRHARV